MLDLEPRVDLEEPEVALGIVEELAGRGVAQRRRLAETDREPVQVPPLLAGESRCRRLLDELLVAALERAVTLPERDDVSLRVREQLHLDVPRRHDLALEIHRAVAERGQRLARPGHERGRQVRLASHAPHAATAAAGGRLHQEREPDRPGGGRGSPRPGPGDRRVPAPASPEPTAPRRVPRAGVRSACRRAPRWWSDDGPTKTIPASSDRARERGALGEEAVARVDRLRARRARRLDDRVDPQVALGGAAGPRRTATSARRTWAASASASL